MTLYHVWPHPELATDFEAAVLGHHGVLMTVMSEKGKKLPVIQPIDVEEVKAFYVSHGGVPWTPGRQREGEVDLYALVKLSRQRYAAIEAACDHHGWRYGFSAIVIAPTQPLACAALGDQARQACRLSPSGKRIGPRARAS